MHLIRSVAIETFRTVAGAVMLGAVISSYAQSGPSASSTTAPDLGALSIESAIQERIGQIRAETPIPKQLISRLKLELHRKFANGVDKTLELYEVIQPMDKGLRKLTVYTPDSEKSYVVGNDISFMGFILLAGIAEGSQELKMENMVSGPWSRTAFFVVRYSIPFTLKSGIQRRVTKLDADLEALLQPREGMTWKTATSIESTIATSTALFSRTKALTVEITKDCKVESSGEASRIHPLLTGKALFIACTGVAQGKNPLSEQWVFLEDAGFYWAKSNQTISGSSEYSIKDIEFYKE